MNFPTCCTNLLAATLLTSLKIGAVSWMTGVDVWVNITAENFSSDPFDGNVGDNDDGGVRVRLGLGDNDDVKDDADADDFGVMISQPGEGRDEARQVGHLKGKSDNESEKDPVLVRRAPGSEFQMRPSRLL